MLLVMAVVLPPSARADEENADPLTAILDAAVYDVDGLVGLSVLDPTAGYAYRHRADVPMESASLYKLVVMVEVFRRAEEDPSFLDSQLEINRLRGVSYMPVREALERMIRWSADPPADALVRRLGLDNLRDTIQSLGLHHTSLGEFAEVRGQNTMSADDVVSLLAALLRHEVVSEKASEEMIALLMRQEINDRISRGVPPGTQFAHKTGSYGNDAGILWSPHGPRIVALITQYVDPAANRDLARRIGAAVYGLPSVAKVAVRPDP